MSAPGAGGAPAPLTASHRKVILASSLGTVFEWYDFYLYGALAAIIAKQFFSALDPTSGFIFALLAFAAGFAVRMPRMINSAMNRPRVAVVWIHEV